MRRRKLLASTTTPDGMRMTLSLHGGDYRIEVDGQGLMSTRPPGLEKALADLAAQELTDNSHPRVLVGGLGLGFTLGAALDVLPLGASVVVVEVTDVVDYLQEVKQPFDAILLDVDNGPDAWYLESNERLYDRPGLIRIRRALKPGGLLAVWSAKGSSVFESRLAEVGFAARSETVRSRERKGERHMIFLGRRG